MKNSKQKNVMDIVKASRKKSREEEIAAYGKPINYKKVIPSKKVYNRKKFRTQITQKAQIFANQNTD